MTTKNKKHDKFITPDKIFAHPEELYKWYTDKNVNPITFEVHLTERCNNKCFYCNYKKSSKDMSIDDFKKVVGKLSKVGVKAVILSGGGEPTLHKNVVDAINVIDSFGMDSAIISNLVLFNEKLYRTILEKCTWCRISFDSSSPEIYKKIRGTEGFGDVIKNIKLLTGYKKKMGSKTTLGLQVVVNKFNMDDIYKEIKLSSELGVDYVQVRPVETMPKEKIPYSKNQYDHIMKQVQRGMRFERKNFKIICSNKWDTINPYNKMRRHDFNFCHAYLLIGAIDVNGDSYVCCHQIEDKNKALCYGNLIKEPVNKVMSRRKKVISKLDLSRCYLECRASNINRCLERLKRPSEHINFL